MKTTKYLIMLALCILLFESCKKDSNPTNQSTPTMTLTVKSSPSSGANVTVSEADKNGNTDGKTTFSRTYEENSQLYLEAPTNFNGKTFYRWNRDNGAYYEYSESYGIGMEKSHTVVAEYSRSIRATKTLTVSSSPSNGTSVTVSVIDVNGNKNGTTSFTRTYNEGQQLYLTAPSIFNGKSFYRWNRDTGEYYEYSESYGIGMDTDHKVAAEYN